MAAAYTEVGTKCSRLKPQPAAVKGAGLRVWQGCTKKKATPIYLNLCKSQLK